MNKLFIEVTRSSPKIHFDSAQHFLSISGESYPENPAKFYAPVLSWLESYLKQLEDQEVTVDIDIPYFNSSSSKVFMDFFDMLEEATHNGAGITINWHYDEDNQSALEAGEDFQEDFELLTFHLLRKDV